MTRVSLLYEIHLMEINRQQFNSPGFLPISPYSVSYVGVLGSKVAKNASSISMKKPARNV